MKYFKNLREEFLTEVLKSSDPASKWISDFVHSDNPKFKGKNKKERIRMALGAKYAAMRSKKGVAEGSDVPHWRVEPSKATGRYYVVTGYTDKSRRVWKSKQGAGDFNKKEHAETKAQELNQGVAEGIPYSYGFVTGRKKPNATTRHLRDYPVSDKDLAKPVKKPEKKKPEQGVAEGSLNELDTSTLKSYRGKANDEVNAIKQKQKLGQLSDKDFFKKQDRLMGIGQATKRIVARGLAKEEKEFSTIQHYCAKHVYSDIFGEGIVLESEHAEPDNEGNIDWYTVQFNHGNEVVFTEDLDILIAEYHDNHKKKKKKNKDIQEKLHPNQKKLDVAEPKGKLTADDFHKLRAMKRKG